MDETDAWKGDDEPNVNYVVEQIQDTDSSIDYGLHTKNGIYMDHYSAIKQKYKQLALTWLIASFIGFGYLASGQEADLPFSNLFAIIFLALIAAAGVHLLWFLDVCIYHRLLRSIFASNLIIENRSKFVSPTHHKMTLLLQTKRFEPSMADGLYYAIISFIILTIGNTSLFLALQMRNFGEFGLIPFSILMIVIILFETLIVYMSRQSSHLKFVK